MANHKSAKKRIKQTAVRTERNKIRKSITRNHVKEVRSEIANGNLDKAKELLPKTQSALAKASKTSAITQKMARRLVSRLTKQATK